MFIRLPGNRIINLARVLHLNYNPDLSEVFIHWDCYEMLHLTGADAIALIHAIDRLNDHRKQQLIDVQQFIDPHANAEKVLYGSESLF